MTEEDFQAIEEHTGFQLPAYYRETMSNYPFAIDSFAGEFMLPDDPRTVIDMLEEGFSVNGFRAPFFVGSDGSEECYFVDASQPDSGVFVFEIETEKHRPLTPSWSGFLDHIRAALAEIAADEEAQRQRKLNKKWWEVWK